MATSKTIKAESLKRLRVLVQKYGDIEKIKSSEEFPKIESFLNRFEKDHVDEMIQMLIDGQSNTEVISKIKRSNVTMKTDVKTKIDPILEETEKIFSGINMRNYEAPVEISIGDDEVKKPSEVKVSHPKDKKVNIIDVDPSDVTEVKAEVKEEPKAEVKAEVKEEPKIDMSALSSVLKSIIDAKAVIENDKVKAEAKTEVKEEPKAEAKAEVKTEPKIIKKDKTIGDAFGMIASALPERDSYAQAKAFFGIIGAAANAVTSKETDTEKLTNLFSQFLTKA